MNDDQRPAKRARTGDGGSQSIKHPASNRLSVVGSSGDTDPAPPPGLDDMCITELLELDSRPTFIIDFKATDMALETDGMSVVFYNKAFKFFDDLRNLINAETYYPTPNSITVPPSPLTETALLVAEFKEWATEDSATDGYLPRHTFRGMLWSSTMLRDRWRVISASQVPHQRRQNHGSPRSSLPNSRSSSRSRISTDGVDEADLKNQLADSMSKFRVLTELNPVGMYYLSPDGDILYCNDMWYEITGHPRGLEGEMSFMNVISELDHPKITEEWQLLTTTRGARSFPLRLRKPSVDSQGNPRQKWILCSCDQEWDEDGKLLTIMGCITDISEQKAAEEHAVQRAKLVEEIAMRTQEAQQHERNFQNMAELVPCGMFTFDPDGAITWANSQWYDMTGHSRDKDEILPGSFLKAIEDHDHETFLTQWNELTIGKREVSVQLRLQKPWYRPEENTPEVNPSGEGAPGTTKHTTWILFLALPQLDDKGNVSKIFGCTTDISHIKWAESVQRQSRLQAEEAKRNQESFIDMTSHEMRNPLSAMLMCADGIADSLVAFQRMKNKSAVISQELVESNLDAAQTIIVCAQHQKRIIDDVLTLSKLNSRMLHVTPIQVQVDEIVRRSVKMFESELAADEITTVFNIEKSYSDANIDQVFCDPVRLTQIFINLLTNAIKFTRTEEKRQITINLGATLTKPPKDEKSEFQWFPSNTSAQIRDLTLAPDWGTGKAVYLYFSVADTGRGLDEEEKTRLFHRFSQASPRTHVQYGGNGLGLFISRELTEMQGGEIGVGSTAGKGSVFAFYIKARMATSCQPAISKEPVDIGPRPTIPPHITLPGPASRKLSITTHAHYNHHILLVEDNLINQKVLRKQLSGIGCTVHVANHGLEALSFLETTSRWITSVNTKSSDLASLSFILMDLEMPIMDGVTCTQRIRELELSGQMVGHVPIIAVTANARAEQMDVALGAGMDDIVTKPFQIPELMQKMDRWCENVESACSREPGNNQTFC